MGQLESTVKQIIKSCEAITRHREIFEINEAQTRTSLIEPMLSVLGWDVSNPAEVTQEYGERTGKADYVFRDPETMEPIMIMEVKRLGAELDIAKEQVSDYCEQLGVGEAIVSNGDEWVGLSTSAAAFDIEDNASMNGRLLEQARFATTRGDAVLNAINAQWFANPNSRVTDWLSDVTSAVRLLGGADVNAPIADSNRTIDAGGSHHVRSLASMRGTNNPPVPSMVHFDDGFVLSVVPVKWSECVRGIAVYLADFKCELSIDDCPVESPRARTRYVANDRPRHIDGQKFVDELEVGDGVFVELNLNGRSAVEASCMLLETCGIDPHSVTVSFDNVL